jgi:SPP1 family predicted phage head-tail adaptor
MSLIDSFKTECKLMEKTRTPDGEGGSITEWVEGTPFMAAVVFNNSLEARAAEKQGVTNLYTVTTDKNTSLEYHDVFKRVSDGKIFRVTSDGDDAKTPDVATFAFSQVSAEEWVLS